jgi:hypothetical protein
MTEIEKQVYEKLAGWFENELLTNPEFALDVFVSEDAYAKFISATSGNPPYAS